MSAFETGNKLKVGPNGEELTRTSITTWSKHILDLADPAPSDIYLDDIARGLSQAVRWAGQGDQWLSVAQHSIETLRAVERRHPGCDIGVKRAALMHDSHEAYIGDLSGGLKFLLREGDLPIMISTLDSAIELAIGFQLRGFLDVERMIKEAEDSLVVPEYEFLFENKKASEVGMEPSMCREMAMGLFLSEAERLGLRRGGPEEGSADSAAGGS
jgi:5'-deoxynucleotidase YfbR-like HD superfamily hydrolase